MNDDQYATVDDTAITTTNDVEPLAVGCEGAPYTVLFDETPPILDTAPISSGPIAVSADTVKPYESLGTGAGADEPRSAAGRQQQQQPSQGPYTVLSNEQRPMAAPRKTSYETLEKTPANVDSSSGPGVVGYAGLTYATIADDSDVKSYEQLDKEAARSVPPSVYARMTKDEMKHVTSRGAASGDKKAAAAAAASGDLYQLEHTTT